MATEGCDCCAGKLDGLGWPCPGCMAAIRRRDRLGHPHELSEAQRNQVAREGAYGGQIDTVSVVTATDRNTGEERVLGVVEDGGLSGFLDVMNQRRGSGGQVGSG